MQLGKVIGTVVSTRKDEKLEGFKFLLLKNCDVTGNPTSGIVVAVDSVGAGFGEVVLYSLGSSARRTKMTEGKPVDAIIMAIVDIIEVEGKKTYVKVE